VMLEATITGDQGTIIEQEIVLGNESSEWLSFTQNHGSVIYGEYGELEVNISAENLYNGDYYQGLVIRDLAGNEIFIPVNLEVTDAGDIDDEVIGQIGITGIYPNPFNPTTNIKFSLKADAKVSLNIYNVRGQKVKTLINDNMQAGYHSIIWDGRDESGKSVTSGVYFSSFDAENDGSDYTSIKKMILLK